ncbi:Flp family type IVb pilin [bacterium]|nr:Flp family type IVb pilin [bacterium]
MDDLFSKFFWGEDAQGMIEYALLVGLIAVVVVFILTASGGTLKSTYTTISTSIEEVNSSVSS